MKLKSWIAAIAIAALPLAAQVHVLASNGVKAGVDELRPQCEMAAGGNVRFDYATSSSLKQRIEGGEAFDVVIMTTDLIDDLVKTGKVSRATRSNIARSGIGVGVRKGATRPDIHNGDAFKRALQSAKSITYAQDGASRVYLEKMFERMGIADVMKRKTILEQGSTRANERVASGDAEIILTLQSEILPAPGVELVGPIPAEYQSYIAFAAGANAKSGHASAANAIIKVLSGPAAASTLKAKGMEPAR